MNCTNPKTIILQQTKNFEKLTDKNECAHDKINEKLDDHETRISIIEHSGKEG